MISNENELSLYSMQDRDSCARTVREIMRVRARGTVPMAFVRTYGCQQNVADGEKIKGQLAPSLVASFMKLFGLCALFLPLAVHMGFRDQKLVAILIMLGSATTVSSFVMAKSMGHDGTLTSNTVIITTLLSAFSLTFWLFVARTGGWI